MLMYFRVLADRGIIQIEIFQLGNIKVILQVFLLRDGMTCPLCLCLGILPGFLWYLIK